MYANVTLFYDFDGNDTVMVFPGDILAKGHVEFKGGNLRWKTTDHKWDHDREFFLPAGGRIEISAVDEEESDLERARR